MKKSLLSLTFTAALVLSASAYAQHGAGGAGGGRPAGAGSGSGSMGAPSGVGRPTDAGSVGTSHTSLAAQSPSKVLDNGKLNTSLSNALSKSGISVPGRDLKSACSAYKNLGQCVAAMHVAKNLNIPGGFAALTDKMTGSNAVSLGNAIQDLSPNTNAKAESKKATAQANHDLSEAETES